MNGREIAEAAQALDAWLTSQDIPASMKAPVLLQWLGLEIVSQGDTQERFDTGLRLLSGLLKHYAIDALMIAKKHGVR